MDPKKKSTLAPAPPPVVENIAPPPIPQVPGKYIRWSYILLFFSGIILYANTSFHDYVLDDAAAITQNKIVQKGVSGIPELLRTGFYYGHFGYNNNLYRPLPLVTFAIGHSLWGNNPHADHIVNIILYGLVGAVLFYMLLQLLGRTRWILCFAIGLLFVAHPIHTEAVANIKGRDEILAFFFSIIALALALRYAYTGKKLLMFCAAASLFLALLSKEHPLAFVVLIPLSIHFFIPAFPEVRKRNIRVSLAGLGVALVYLGIRYFLFHNDPKTTADVMTIDNVMSNSSFFERLPTAIMVLGRYLLLLVFPHPLVYDYSFKELMLAGWGDLRFLVSLVVLLALAVFAVMRFQKKNAFAYAILFFFITIGIVSNIFLVIGTGMAERVLFTPSLAYCMVIGFLAFKLTKASEHSLTDLRLKNVLGPVLGLILGVFFFKTVARNRDWKDQLTLFSHDVKIASRSARTQYCFGTELIEASMKEKDAARKHDLESRAETALKRSLSIYPSYPEAVLALGNLYQAMGDPVRAAEYLSRVTATGMGAGGDSEGKLYYNKANALLGAGNYREAITYYSMAIATNPEVPDFYVNMGVAYKEMNLLDSAILTINKAIAINPNSPEAYLNLGTCYSAAGKFDKAIENFNKAIALKADFAEAYVDIGDAWDRMNQPEKALQAYQKAYELNPSIPEAAFNLGYFYVKRNDFVKAIPYLKKAVELRPQYLDALMNLSFCESKMGNYADMIMYAQRAAEIRPDMPEIYFNIAYGYEKLGDIAKATEFQQRGNMMKDMKSRNAK